MSEDSLNDVEQYLLQQFLFYGVLDQYNFKEIFKKILQKYRVNYNKNDNEAFKRLIVDIIHKINSHIKPISLEIKSGVSEVTGLTFYCLVRQYDLNDIGKLNQFYSQTELKIFKIILNGIVESDDGTIGENYIISKVGEEPSLKVTNKEVRQIIDKFIKDYWIESKENLRVFALHGRALIELSKYLTDVYGTDCIMNCILCKDIVIIGITCDKCNKKMHKHCAKRLFKTQTECTNCSCVFQKDKVLSALTTPISQSQTNSRISITQRLDSSTSLSQIDVTNTTTMSRRNLRSKN